MQKPRTLFAAIPILLVALIPNAPAEPSAKPVDVSPRQVFVVNTQDASVSWVDIPTMKELRRFKVGPRPYGIAVSRDGKTVAVGVEDEECVKFFSVPGLELKGRAHVGKMHNDHIVLTQDGKHILVANFFSDDILGISMETMKEEFRIKECSAPHVVKYGPHKKLAYVTCKKITGIAVIDPESRKLVKFHQLNVNPRSMTFSPDESKVYFGPFWVNGIFEMDAETGKVTRLFELPPPDGSTGAQEVTYHGVESVYPGILLAANEGRSCVDAVDTTTGKLLHRLTDVAKPCCVERIPGLHDNKVRVLISNIGDEGTLQLVEVSRDGRLQTVGKTPVGKAPKRVAFLPQSSEQGNEPLRSGPQVAPRLPGTFHPLSVFHAEKPSWAGKRHDFVEQYGADPVVMVFARQISGPFSSLVKKLDEEVGKRKSDKLKAVVVVLMDDASVEADLRKLAQAEGIRNISLAVMAPTGPRGWQLAPEADLTAVFYRRHRVEANLAFRTGEWTEKSIDRLLVPINRLVAD